MEFAFRPYRLRVVERFCGCLYRASCVLPGFVVLLERLDECTTGMLPHRNNFTGGIEALAGEHHDVTALELDDNFFGPGFV
jgi:hypothetical protein